MMSISNHKAFRWTHHECWAQVGGAADPTLEDDVDPSESQGWNGSFPCTYPPAYAIDNHRLMGFAPLQGETIAVIYIYKCIHVCMLRDSGWKWARLKHLRSICVLRKRWKSLWQICVRMFSLIYRLLRNIADLFSCGPRLTPFEFPSDRFTFVVSFLLYISIFFI